MIPQYNPMSIYDIDDRFIFNDKVCKALDIIPIGERLVLFDPNTLKGNYIEVAEIVK